MATIVKSARRFALASILVLISSAAATAQWSTSDVTIASIEVSNVNAAAVWLSFNSAPFPGAIPCPSTNGQYVLGGANATIVSQMVSTAQLALVHSRKVTVYRSGCAHTYPRIIGITMK